MKTSPILILLIVSFIPGSLWARIRGEVLPASASEAVSTHTGNVRVPAGASWTESYFPSSDGAVLHADILRPVNMASGSKVPIVLSVGPYFSHAGQVKNEAFTQAGPSTRFLSEGTEFIKHGYAFVMVDLRGFGGSTGCLDWVGPGEQTDVASAIAWARRQPWATGKVGMFGKSYDAITGLVGMVLGSQGPDAVVAQEPVWNLYNYLFNNRVPRWNHLVTPEAFNRTAQISAMSDDSDQYALAAAYEQSHPECLQNNLRQTQEANPASAYWKARNLPQMVKGSKVPLFFTQGTLEDNTMPEEMEPFLDHHHGPEYGWIGPWTHVKGNDVDEAGRLSMGRAGWVKEVLAFFDFYLKGDRGRGKTPDPSFAVEDNLGRWRAQSKWPHPLRRQMIQLGSGSYVDNGKAAPLIPDLLGIETDQEIPGDFDMEHQRRSMNTARRLRNFAELSPSASVTSFSSPVDRPVRLTGAPVVTLATSGNGNVVVDLWDVDPKGSAVLINEMISLLGKSPTRMMLRSMDWTLAQGHRLAVRVGTTFDLDYWMPKPSNDRVSIRAIRLTLFLQDPASDIWTEGLESPWLSTYVNKFMATSQGFSYPDNFVLNTRAKGKSSP